MPVNPSPVLKFAAKIGTRKWLVVAVFLSLAGALSATVIPNLFPFFDPTGVVSTYGGGPIREDGPFFQSLGTNGCSCGTCHQASDAMGLASKTSAPASLSRTAKIRCSPPSTAELPHRLPQQSR